MNFGRVVRMAIRYKFTFAASIVSSLMVAILWGANIGTIYPVVERQLESGDRVIFSSDGIAEVMDASGKLFGYDRTEETVLKACAEGLSSEGMIDRILSEVDAFRGDVSRSDDMTLVVMRVL